jgi:hypothetical protein
MNRGEQFGAQVVSHTAATLVGVKVSEIPRLIGKDGWYLDRQRGSFVFPPGTLVPCLSIA